MYSIASLEKRTSGKLRLNPFRRCCFLLVAAFGALALPAKAKAADPSNVFVGQGAGANVTTGGNNTGIGLNALNKDTDGSDNTATGTGALEFNPSGTNNTATGLQALGLGQRGSSNTATGSFSLALNTGNNNTATGMDALYSNTGNNNTATGFDALSNNDTGTQNTATGAEALGSNTTGGNNTATGFNALLKNTSGFSLTATGAFALNANTTGTGSTADGGAALFKNTTGKDNIAMGVNALFNNTTGSSNVALGNGAGVNLTTGSNNIDIGANVLGKAGEANTIRIGSQGTQKSTFIAGISAVAVTGSTVVVNSMGKLGVATSSARFKEAIKPMDNASEALLKLKPATFRYKEQLDPDKIPQFGLIAEEVEKVNPDLVVRGEDGKLTTVRYEAVNAMLLNEFLKEHRTVAELKSLLVEQQAINTRQQKELQILTAALRAETAEIRKISDRVELFNSSPQMVTKNY